MSTDVITIAQELETHALSLVQQAQNLAVRDQAEFSRAGTMLRAVKGYLVKVAEVFDPVIRSAHTAHKTAVEQKKKLEAPALQAERLLKTAMATYEQEQERLRKAAEAAAQRERERLEADAKAAAEAEAAKLRIQAENQRLEKALMAEGQGDAALADRLLAEPLPEVLPQPVVVFTPPPTVETPTAEGISFREHWTGEVTDLTLLVKAAAAGEAPLTLLKVDQVALNGMARALKGSLSIPGVRPIMERVAAVRG